MNQISNAYLNHLIISAYWEASNNEVQVCAITKVNDPVRNDAIMATCQAFVVVQDYDLVKQAGIVSCGNVWD